MSDHKIQRRKSLPVFVGNVGVGGHFPIRIQSMLTSDTKNTEACVLEIQNLVAAGCEIIRLTVPTKTDLENLKNIRAEMRKHNLSVPLVADIHFTPSIALDAVDWVEKVRINPGNFVDKKLFEKFEYSDADYNAELERLEKKFAPLVLKCKQKNIAMRIGTNHGSLSDRILNRYGDTPQGMVESALEFLRIAHKLNYHNIILSMKASNVQVMINAYRLLAKRLSELHLPAYPFHLGVTEAGDGEDGRIKSAIGIGTLLSEGLGDTIRVSLTEDSVHEIPVAYALAAPYNAAFTTDPDEISHTEILISPSKYQAAKRHCGELAFGGDETVRVWTSFGQEGFDHSAFARSSDPAFEGVEFCPENMTDAACKELKKQGRVLGVLSADLNLLTRNLEFCKRTWIVKQKPERGQIQNLLQFCRQTASHLEFCLSGPKPETQFWLESICQALQENHFSNVSFSLLSSSPIHDYKTLAHKLKALGRQDPLHLRLTGKQPHLLLTAATQIGGLLIDGIGNSIQILDTDLKLSELLSLSYGILQASRVRAYKTEYIACPSCGRTQFHLQDVTARIKACTAHLKGVKIGIMGCIVNGPGEMADADFGYVGTGPGKISLYVGQTCVERHVPEEKAVERLMTLIKSHGKWIEPPKT